MSKFKVGDMVMVVNNKTCCNSAKKIGEIHIIKSYRVGSYICSDCNKRMDSPSIFYSDEYFVIEESRLKLIPPLNELEEIETTKHLHVD